MTEFEDKTARCPQCGDDLTQQEDSVIQHNEETGIVRFQCSSCDEYSNWDFSDYTPTLL